MRRKINQHEKEMKNLKGKVATLTKKSNEASGLSPSGTPTTPEAASPALRTDQEEIERLRQQLAKAHCRISTLTQHMYSTPVASLPAPDELPQPQQQTATWENSGQRP